MPLLRPKSGLAAASPLQGAIAWHYDRSEIIADGVVHVLGLVCGLIAATALVVLTGLFGTLSDIVSVSVYVTGLLAMLGFSAAYNLWPVSNWKWVLRRFDHAAIYFLIAATYTPIVMQMPFSAFAAGLLVGIWCVAVLGIVIKLRYPGRLDRLSIALYLMLGWSGVIVYDNVLGALPPTPFVLIAAGGVLYTFGVIFHAWQRLRYQNAIWHSFVLLGAACHYTAVLDLVLT
jgi:hemolysin III